MKYKKYNYSIRNKVVLTKLNNPNISFEQLSLQFNITCPETIRYWFNSYKTKGDISFKDKRHKVAGTKWKKH